MDLYSSDANLSWHEMEYLRAETFAGLFIGLDVTTMIAIIAGNGMVLCLVIRYKRLRTTTNIYIISLCIADILVAIITVPLQILGHFSASYLTTEFCKAIEFVDHLALASNIFCVVAIAFDRHRAVVHPLRRTLTFRQCLQNIGLVWLASGVYGIRGVFVYDITEERHFIHEEWQSFFKCAVPEDNINVNKYFFILDFVVLYAIPLCIILVLYAKIWNSMHKGASKVHAPHVVTKRKKKVLKMLLMVVLVFAFCQLPVKVWHLRVYWGEGAFAGYLILLEIFDLISFTNGWLNVVAYILFNESFSKLIFPCKRTNRVGPQNRNLATVEGSITTA